ncbi:protein kinase domain-containing protein [Ktedonobacter racemifer]|uniref:Serine/threonine protein kinase n=1 Tax=Ktedonobacter racemifer DSM 44963 TaxID=485913 RepID=D6U8K6_KTERA|nr:protein kinase [Ktedonobacter racemifer]EFH80217.1 serine/threonine protein kinase [Ktedonobacter racemifer DSM 44963]
MATHHMLQPGQELRTKSGMVCVIKEFLGGGGQGEVYRADLANTPMALKWYFPQFATNTQYQALENLVRKGPPDQRFLWPLDLIERLDQRELGYLMPLRDKHYVDIVDLMKRRVSTTFRELTTAGLYLADSYHQLHTHGLCYRDISFGNVFLDPQTGEVLICDNDNVTINGETAGGVLGTSRFMAPEIVRHEARPSTHTDLYSLSVLLFYLFMFHHPLEGQREADIHVLDGYAMDKIYGTEPIFIFDPNNTTNRPVRGYQDNALTFWPLYPQFLRDLFTRAFTDGLSNPVNGRVRETEWRSAMIQLRDAIFYCPHCQSQNFYDVTVLKQNNGKPNPCWHCQKAVILPYRLRLNDHIIMLNHDTVLFPHHIDRKSKWDFSRPVAQVNQHPSNPQMWGLKNLSLEKWVLTKVDGSKQDVEPGRNAPLVAGSKINFGDGEGEIRY